MSEQTKTWCVLVTAADTGIKTKEAAEPTKRAEAKKQSESRHSGKRKKLERKAQEARAESARSVSGRNVDAGLSAREKIHNPEKERAIHRLTLDRDEGLRFLSLLGRLAFAVSRALSAAE